MKNICNHCNTEFESKTSTKRYCSIKCENDDRKILIEINNKTWYIYKENFEKYPEYYLANRCNFGDAIKNKCIICEIEFNKYSRTCSKKCSKILSQNTCLKNFGSTSNLNKDSIGKKEINKIVKEKYGVDNVFQLKEVKDKILKTFITKYNITNPSYNLNVKLKRRKTGEKNGTVIPLHLKNEWDYYKMHVHSCTKYSVNRFGFKYWGKDFIKKWNKYDHHVDHIYSVYDGFINKIPAYIIASFSNLRFIPAKQNMAKSKKSLITKEELLNNYYDFFISEYEKTKPLTEKLLKLIEENKFFIKNIKTNEYNKTKKNN